MKMKKTATMLLSIVLFFIIANEAYADPLTETRELIREYYVDEVPEHVLKKKTIKEMTDQLDVYSEYMTRTQFQKFINDIENRYVGIGVVLAADAKGVKVETVIKNSPAEKSNLQQGDLIVQVDGRKAEGKSLDTVVNWLAGNENTSVTIMIERSESKQLVTKKMIRAAVTIPVVEHELLGGDIGYIRLNSFANQAAIDIAKAIRQMPQMSGTIVDFRMNGGGFINAAQEVAGFFPGTKHVFQLRERNRKPLMYEAVVQPVQFQKPVSLLINGYSASASEMVAGAVKDQKSAVLYGQTTYGKGAMQTLFDFQDGSALKLTTARFTTPDGRKIDKTGIPPHVTTQAGLELAAAHRDQLRAKWKNYKQHASLQKVPVNKTFTIEMNKSMDWIGKQAEGIQLIQLGGLEQNITITVKDEKTLIVQPKKPLLSGQTYWLVVHPKWSDKQNKQMKQGMYTEVTVQ